MGALIPLLLALVATEFLSHQPRPTAAWPAMLGAVVVVAGLWFLLAEAAARVVAWHGERSWLRAWEHIAQGMMLGLFLWLGHDRGWSAWAPGYTAGIAPWVLLQCLLWWTLAPTLRGVAGAPWSRAGLVLHHLRFDLAPLLIALPLIDICTLVGTRLGIIAWFQGPNGLLLAALGGWLLILAILSLLPILLVRLWGARPLAAGPIADALAADCKARGLGDVRLRVWGSPGGQVHNAVALGVWPGPRWVLVSADLLQDLPLAQVRAVVGHELGHHHHRHLVAYLWFGLIANFALMELASTLLGNVDASGAPLPAPLGGDGAAPHLGAVFTIPGIDVLPPLAVIGVTGAALVLLLWRVLFGALSRACERQADIAGAELAGYEHMAGALRAVARLSNTPEDAPSWRHRPIAERVAYLGGLAASPGTAKDHHRLVRDMRLLLLASLALLVVLLVSLRFGPLGEAATTTDPAARIAEQAKADPALAAALASADIGDTRALIDWLNRADVQERRQLAALLFRQVELSGGKDAAGKPLPPDDRTLYALRWRLSALDAVSLEDEGLDLDLDNTFAYALVAGTAHPTPHDIELARGDVLRRLEAAVARRPNHAIYDTIGCVRFVSGEYEAARKAFAEAARLAALPGAGDPAAATLYGRRRDAAAYNLANAKANQPPKPLPLTFQEPAIP